MELNGLIGKRRKERRRRRKMKRRNKNSPRLWRVNNMKSFEILAFLSWQFKKITYIF